jgi:hypothetical protein
MANWDRTRFVDTRLEGRLSNQHHLGGRDRPIDGSAGGGKHQREIITVDYRNSRVLQDLYDRVSQKAAASGKITEESAIDAVYDVVKAVYTKKSSKAVNALLKRHGIGPDEPISLDEFVKEGTGVCRHMAMTVGVILEKYVRQGYLRGEVSVDRNTDVRGGHAWVRYTHEDGKVTIIDVMQNFKGSLRDAMKLEYAWSYARPAEHAKGESTQTIDFTSGLRKDRGQYPVYTPD